MRLSILASGSSGNAVLLEADGARVLIDCGLSTRQIQRRMELSGTVPHALDAVLVTHEHSDHVRGLEVFCRRFKAPLLATAGTAAGLPAGVVPAGLLTSGREIRFGELVVTPVATCHDAREPVGFVCEHRGCRVGLVTDTGCITELLAERLTGCHALLLEANHDVEMLRYGSYPWYLKQRIASRTGHLSNEQCRDALERTAHGELEVVVGMHLSQENNRPDVAARELRRPLAGSGIRVEVACQDTPLVVDVAGPSGA